MDIQFASASSSSRPFAPATMPLWRDPDPGRERPDVTAAAAASAQSPVHRNVNDFLSLYSNEVDNVLKRALPPLDPNPVAVIPRLKCDGVIAPFTESQTRYPSKWANRNNPAPIVEPKKTGFLEKLEWTKKAAAQPDYSSPWSSEWRTRAVSNQYELSRSAKTALKTKFGSTQPAQISLESLPRWEREALAKAQAADRWALDLRNKPKTHSIINNTAKVQAAYKKIDNPYDANPANPFGRSGDRITSDSRSEVTQIGMRRSEYRSATAKTGWFKSKLSKVPLVGRWLSKFF